MHRIPHFDNLLRKQLTKSLPDAGYSVPRACTQCTRKGKAGPKMPLWLLLFFLLLLSVV